MTRTRILWGALAALVLLASACGGGDGDGDGDSATGATTEAVSVTSTTEAAVPGNPEGDFLLLRWAVDTDNPAGASMLGLATTRLWNLTPTCDGDDPCDLTLAGAGEGGTLDPPEFGSDPVPETSVTYESENEVWAMEQDLGPIGACRDAEGNYVQDFTTMDAVDRTEFTWDESGTRLVGTKTEAYTLNDAGRANADCAPDSDEVITYDVVIVPQAELDAGVAEPIELADEYVQSREVYSVEGTDVIAPFDWRVFEAPVAGGGSCGPDACDATLTFDQGETDPPLELALSYDDGRLTGLGTQVGSCITAASAAAGEADVLTEEGYDVEFEVELTPVVLDDAGNTALVTNGHYVITPLPEAAAEFPDDCATVEDIGSFNYLIPAARAE